MVKHKQGEISSDFTSLRVALCLLWIFEPKGEMVDLNAENAQSIIFRYVTTSVSSPWKEGRSVACYSNEVMLKWVFPACTKRVHTAECTLGLLAKVGEGHLLS